MLLPIDFPNRAVWFVCRYFLGHFFRADLSQLSWPKTVAAVAVREDLPEAANTPGPTGGQQHFFSVSREAQTHSKRQTGKCRKHTTAVWRLGWGHSPITHVNQAKNCVTPNLKVFQRHPNEQWGLSHPPSCAGAVGVPVTAKQAAPAFSRKFGETKCEASDGKPPLVSFKGTLFWAALRSPAKSLIFSGSNGNYHDLSLKASQQNTLYSKILLFQRVSEITGHLGKLALFGSVFSLNKNTFCRGGCTGFVWV